MTELLNIAVIGVGHLGKEHARIYSELDKKGFVRFAGVFDADKERAQTIARKLGGRVFQSLDEVIESVDAVSVVTPTEFHFEVGEKFLQAGKHCLIEKPITNNLADAEKLVALAQQHGLALQVGHIERFNPVLRSLESRLTEPRFIEVHRLSPYPERSLDIGVVLDVMIHDIDIVLHLVRSPLIRIDAVGLPVLSRKEDIANARLTFQNGCVANITASRISPDKMRKFRVFQAEDASRNQPASYLSMDYLNQEAFIYFKQDGKIKREKVPVEKDEPLKLELQSFVEAIRVKRQPVVSGRQATAALDVAMSITQQIASITPQGSSNFLNPNE